jgi:hypothetical protein
MTREEAANWIEHYCYGNTSILRDCDDDITEKIQTAMDKAIAALRENPCDNCVGPGLAIAHGYKDMRTKKPEVEG